MLLSMCGGWDSELKLDNLRDYRLLATDYPLTKNT